MICVRMQPGRIDKLEPATGPPDYKPRSRSRMAEVSNSDQLEQPLEFESPSTSGTVHNPSGHEFFHTPEQNLQFGSGFASSSSWAWPNLLSQRDEGLSAAIAGHKRPRADVDEFGAASWSGSDPSVIARLARDMEIQARASEVGTLSWAPGASSSHGPLGEVVTKATESRSSPGAAGYSSSPSWMSSCSSDSGIQHSDICCKPYFSPPRSSNPGS